jgi:hypothetical protein
MPSRSGCAPSLGFIGVRCDPSESGDVAKSLVSYGKSTQLVMELPVWYDKCAWA